MSKLIITASLILTLGAASSCAANPNGLKEGLQKQSDSLYLDKIKKQVEGVGGEMLDRVGDLEKQRDALSEQIDKAKDAVGEMSDEDKEKLKKQFDELTEKTGEVLKDLEKKN